MAHGSRWPGSTAGRFVFSSESFMKRGRPHLTPNVRRLEPALPRAVQRPRIAGFELTITIGAGLQEHQADVIEKYFFTVDNEFDPRHARILSNR
jgi:hypothetical protein